uniref:Coatomer gamma subunit appendage Ig-like subdomain domain-containing protein n=1 Tax=Phlebotomus papatasi TaxID=29031 RepID=A0A1B0DBM5_PHLPP
FDCVNTLSDQLLENVRVDLVLPEGFIARAVIPCTKLPYSEVGSTYVIVEFPNDVPSSVATLCATLKFIVKDCDPATGQPDSHEGYDDEYILEDLEITLADQWSITTQMNNVHEPIYADNAQRRGELKNILVINGDNY